MFLGLFLFVFMFDCNGNNRGGEYPDCGLIVEIDEANDLVTYHTQNGNVFSFYGAEDYSVGDLVATVMNDGGTPEVTDDIVVTARYVGCVDDVCVADKEVPND